MDTTGSMTTVAAGTAAPGRRSDAGVVRLTDRDVAGLLLAGDMYGSPYDLLASFLGVQPARLRGIVARWRSAGYAQTARLGPGPAATSAGVTSRTPKCPGPNCPPARTRATAWPSKPS
jgi:hypothetical protein